jgi:hypothetical protein
MARPQCDTPLDEKGEREWGRVRFILEKLIL